MEASIDAFISEARRTAETKIRRGWHPRYTVHPKIIMAICHLRFHSPMPREIIENIIKLIGADVIVNAHDITLTGSAMATVDGDKEIAESIINFFGRHLMAKYSDSYIWDTVIYTRMARAGGYDRVVAREWNKRRDKEHVKRILCPQRVHGIWTLAVLRVEGMAQNVPEITIIHSVDTSEEDTDMIHFILEALYMDIHGGVNPSMADIYERGSDRRRAATSAAYLIEAMRRTVMQVNEPTRTLQQIHKYINDTIATYRRRQSPTTLSTDRWDDEADEDGDEPNTDDPPTGRPPKKTRNKNPSGRTQWNSSRTTTLTIDPTTTAHAIVGDGNWGRKSIHASTEGHCTSHQKCIHTTRTTYADDGSTFQGQNDLQRNGTKAVRLCARPGQPDTGRIHRTHNRNKRGMGYKHRHILRRTSIQSEYKHLHEAKRIMGNHVYIRN